jgi:hypothetical protein
MKYYINKNKVIFGFELDGSQDYLITDNMSPISLEEIEAINKAKEDEYMNTLEYKLNEAKQYLQETGWIWEKYNRNVLVLKDTTSEEFAIKYADIIAKQEESRLLIKELEKVEVTND